MASEPPAPGSLPLAVGLLRSVGSFLLRVPRRLGFLPPLLWAGLIFAASSRTLPDIGVRGPVPSTVENLGHAVEYGILAALLALSAPRRDGWVVLDRRTVVLILGLCALYAASDEWHQSFVPHRDATPYDVLTDGVGAAATLACIDALGKLSDVRRTFSLRFAIGLLASLAAAILATSEP